MRWKHQGITDQTRAAINRRRDARSLLRQGELHTRGAMYLAGYAIECKVKAKAMERNRATTLGELRSKLNLKEDQVYSHGLESLIEDLLPNGVGKRLREGHARTPFVSQVNRWSPQWRYDGGNPPIADAKKFLDAVDEVWEWLESNS